MLDDYNYLEQFEVVSSLNLYKKLLTKVPARELKKSDQKIKKVIFLANYNYLPFLFVKKLLENKEVEIKLVIGEENLPKDSKKYLIISNFRTEIETKNIKILKNRPEEPIFIADVMTILDICKIIDQYNLTKDIFVKNREYLREVLHQSEKWHFETILTENLPKQISIYCLGKNLLFFSSNQFSPVAMAFNYYSQNLAKNIAFNQNIEDLAHQLAPGWTSHPIDKQWAVFDIVSKLDSKQNRQYFAYKSRFLSGMMPASKIHFLKGETENEQLWYGLILAQFSSLYLASLNKVNPLKNKILDKF